MSALPRAPLVALETASSARAEQVIPGWALRLVAEDNGAPYVGVSRFLSGGYCPFSRDKTYAALGRYCDRIARLAKKRSGAMLSLDEQLPRENELPGRRDGRQMLVSKRLYIISVLGYLPRFPEHQP